MEAPAIFAIAIGITLLLFWLAYAANGIWRRITVAGAILLSLGAGWTLQKTASASGWDSLSWFVLAGPLLGLALSVWFGLGWRKMADQMFAPSSKWPKALVGLLAYLFGAGLFVLIVLSL